jgi:hypothetical protein
LHAADLKLLGFLLITLVAIEAMNLVRPKLLATLLQQLLHCEMMEDVHRLAMTEDASLIAKQQVLLSDW